ncbi:DUF1764-domain-containing protein [Gloeophyllum trabeum ATCC 11539]|uniref:DUF1764-domain-containing protein n=1 Tax=Gloeophyllum trabeum (strain ATCC 11539 / FP-39264 / Madison 617) TaxID=670483 RepID=S7QMP6_GLOTA|nr:DUF1764-domain-containing protein [Gloeophyllum trabeum ATCC 11539]EPQ60846.1 DUF1764-domain-containing protein [Gloeophyllum trabeum ATCC 11539]
MAKSEIDDIFASKGKVESKAPVASSSAAQEKKKKNKKKSKDKEAVKSADDPIDDPPKASLKRCLPQTIVDTSSKVEARPAKRPKVERKGTDALEATKQKKSKKGDEKEDEERFRDSRGTGPRRRTEEGFAIYNEDELGISAEAGDTPLCPFDCDCCF